MRWIVALLATITAANAVPREEFYGDNNCSCGNIGPCCDEVEDDYYCICHSNHDSSISIPLTSPESPLPFYGQNYTYACVSDILCIIYGVSILTILCR